MEEEPKLTPEQKGGLAEDIKKAREKVGKTQKDDEEWKKKQKKEWEEAHPEEKEEREKKE